MPIYEYSCKKCGQTIEVIQKMSDPELKKHKQCGGALTKLISASGFQFKGTGWYVTDYAKTGQPKSSEGSEAKDTKETKEQTPASPMSKDGGGKTSEPSPSKESSKGSSESSKESSSKTSKPSDSKK